MQIVTGSRCVIVRSERRCVIIEHDPKDRKGAWVNVIFIISIVEMVTRIYISQNLANYTF